MRLAAAALVLLSGAASRAPAQSFEELSAKAREAYEAQRSQEAAALYQKALKLRPDWAQGWWVLGTLHYEADRYPACRDALTRLVKLDPEAAPGFALLGVCEFHTKQYDSAFEHLKRAHMLVPPGKGGRLLDIANYHLALVLIRQGAFELAHQILIEVAHNVKENPEMVFACGLASLRIPLLPAEVPAADRDVIALAGKAFWDLTTRPPAEAAADFQALVTKYPNYPNVHYFYGTYLGAHRPQDSAREFLEELRVSPDSVPARVQLALRFIVEQRLDEALKLAREAVKMSPESAGTHAALGRVLRARGDDAGALAAFLKAKELSPATPEIRLYLVAAYRALGQLEDMRREQAEHDRLKAELKNWP